MSPHAVAVSCAACIYLVHGAFQWMQAMVEPTRKELPAFALGCMGLSLYCLGTVLIVEQDQLGGSAAGQNLHHASAAFITLCYARFEQRLTGEDQPRTIFLCRLLLLLTLLACGLGVYVSEAPLPAPPLALSWAPPFRLLALTPTGLVLTLAMMALIGLTTVRVARAASEAAEARAILVAAAVVMPAMIHDGLVRSGALRSMPLFEFASLGIVLGTASVVGRGYLQAGRDLERGRARLRSSSAALGEAQTQLAQVQRMARLGEFAAIIAHEVRNPLAILRNVTSRLQARERPPLERQELARIMTEESQRLRALVHDLAAYTEPVSPNTTRLQLEPLLRRSVERVRAARPEATGVQFQLQVEAAASELLGDEKLLTMALSNLLDNAVLSLQGDGRIQLSAARGDGPGEPLVITVADNGAGMDAQAAARSLEPFFTTRATGTGLGLTIVDRVVRAQGGRVSVQSSPRGTRVSLSFEPAKGSPV